MYMRVINHVITGHETRLGLKTGSFLNYTPFYTHVE